ncbi:MFS transporter [Micromonospora foliorum]|uniref:MFS transporter n=1 Tax=Micromonospora foliorum TaxID=2911210 RepID=UPI001EE789AC|nr:MFS transporter [Micromonospora foliorum]MCG5439814.1 MFS transporter [Micromonospora foliorum]
MKDKELQQHGMDAPAEADIGNAETTLWTSGFRWYLTGTSVSLLGTAMAPVALAFSVLEHSSSVYDLGWVLAARSIPLVAFLLVGGAVADRFPRSTVLKLSNLGAASTQGVVAFLLLSGRYSLMLIIALEFLNGSLTAFTQPAMRGIIPQLVAKAQMRRANSLVASSKNAITILGPTAAGITVATVGGGWAIALDSASYLLAAFFISRIRLSEEITRSSRSVLSDVREGWSEFRSIPWVWSVVASLAVTNLLKTGIWVVLGPAIAITTIGAASWGGVLSARAVGLLVMGLVMYRLTVRRLLGTGQLFFALGCLPLIALGVGANALLLFIAAFMAGIGSGMFGPAWETSLQEHVPNNALSRVASYDDLFSYVTVPIGMMCAAPAGAIFGNERVALVGGILFLAAALLPLLSRSVYNLRHG